MKNLIHSALTILLFATAVRAQEPDFFPAYFDVVGVARSDVLNLRAGPGTDFPVVGQLLPDARNIPVVDRSPDGKWVLMRHGEGVAWARLSYLARVPGQDGSRLPASLNCAGTEPFWGLKISQNSALFDDIEGQSVRLDRLWDGKAIGWQPYKYGVRLEGDQSAIQAVINRGQCDDGMSDIVYGFSIEAILSGELGDVLLVGCCALP